MEAVNSLSQIPRGSTSGLKITMKRYHGTPDYLKPCLLLAFSLPHHLSILFPSPEKTFFPDFHKLTLHLSGVSLSVSPQRRISDYIVKRNPLVIFYHCPLFISLHNPSCTHIFLCSPEYHRHISFYCASHALKKKKKQIEGLW